jgi:membrane protein YqaA with SNARE-associated domain
MDASPFIFDVFTQAISTAFIVPFNSNITLQAMKEFGGYALQEPAYVAVLGMVIGCLISWALGYSLSILRSKVAFLGGERFATANSFMHKYGYVLVALFWLPLGTLAVLVSGFFRVPAWKVILLSMIGGFFMLRDYFA